jgi:hypothetical protein
LAEISWRCWRPLQRNDDYPFALIETQSEIRSAFATQPKMGEVAALKSAGSLLNWIVPRSGTDFELEQSTIAEIP